MKIRTSVASVAALAAAVATAASGPPQASRDGVYLPTTTTQSEADEYTQYELLARETQLPDGRVRLDYWDDRPEAVDVLLKARRRVGAQR